MLRGAMDILSLLVKKFYEVFKIIPIPEKKRVIIILLDDKFTDIDTQNSKDIAGRQRLAFEKYRLIQSKVKI